MGAGTNRQSHLDPPEGGDSEPSDESGDDDKLELEFERRRLGKEMQDYFSVIKPISGVVNYSNWLDTATTADRKMHADIIAAMKSFPQEIANGDYESIQAYANKTATKLLEQNEGCGVGKAMGIHLMMSAHTTNSYRAVEQRDPSKAADFSDKSTFFLTHVAGALAWRLSDSAMAESPNPATMYEIGRQNSEAVANFVEETKDWVDAKIHGFNVALIFRGAADHEIAREVPLETASLEKLRRINDKFMGMANAKRGHTIKPATHEGEGTAWSVHDYEYIREQTKKMLEAEGSDMRLYEWAPRMRMVALEHDPADTEAEQGVITPTFMSLGGDQFEESGRDLYRICMMDSNGELFVDVNGAMSLRVAYKRHGKEVNYEALRQYMITTFSRLTAPTRVEREAQDAAEQVLGRDANQMPQGWDPENREVIHDLLLPRMSVWRSYTKQQFAEMEQEERRIGEVVDEDDNVVGHVRNINSDYRASEGAREEARKYGIELPPKGMTFVAAHYHPLAGKAGTHRAKRRKDGGGREE